MATKIKGTGIATGAIDSTQLATLSGHFDLLDSNNIRLGNSQDLKLYHHSNHSYIENNTGTLFIDAAAVSILDGSNTSASFTPAGATTLYNAGTARIATSSSGAAVTGNLAVTGSNGVIDIATSGNEINFSRNAANYLNATGASASLVFLTNNSTALTLNSGQNATFAGNVVVTGDLTVNGTNTTLNVSTLEVEDKAITVAKGAANATAANESGLIVAGASANMLYLSAGDEFRFNKPTYVDAGYKTGTTSTFVGQLTNSGGKLRLQSDSNRDIEIGDTNNADIIYVDTSEQHVGIGVSAPSKKLHVEDSSAYQLQVDGGNNFWNVGAGWSGYYDGSFLIANNTGDKLVIDSTGKVGIGINGPSYPLDVQRSSGHSYIRTKSTASNTRAALLTTGEDSSGNEVKGYFGSVGDANEIEIASLSNHQIKFYVNNTPTKGMIIDTDGDIGMGVSPATHAKLTLGGTTTSYSSVLAFDNNTAGGGNFFMLASDNTWSAGAGKFLMGHGAPSSSAVDVTIDGDGKVGIGTYTVDEMLHVERTSGTTLIKTEVASNSIIGFEIAKTNATTQSWRIVDGQTVNGRLQIYDLTDSRVDMTFDGSGNVGIGTSAPSNYSTETTLKINGSGWGRLDLATGDVVRTSLFAGSGYTALTAGTSRITLNQNSHIAVSTAGAERFKIGTSGDLQIGYGGAALQQVTTAALSVITPANSGGQNIAFKRLDSNNDQGLGALTWSNNTQDNQAKIFVKTAGATNTTDMQFHVNSAGTLKEAITINGSHANGAVGIGETDPTQAKVVIKSHGATTELALLVKDSNNNDTFFVQGGGRVGTNYWPLTVGIPAATAAATSAKFQVEEAGLLTVLTNGHVGIGLTSPQLPLDIMPDSSKKLFGSQQNSTQHGFCEYVISGTIGAGSVTITMQCPSYFQAEVVATFQQSNGGSDNNVYFNGVWTNNHTTHLFKNKTNGGTVPRIGSMGTNPTFSVGVGDAASNSGKLIFTKAAHSGTSGTYCVRVIAYGYSSRYMTYVVS